MDSASSAVAYLEVPVALNIERETRSAIRSRFAVSTCYGGRAIEVGTM